MLNYKYHRSTFCGQMWYQLPFMVRCVPMLHIQPTDIHYSPQVSFTITGSVLIPRFSSTSSGLMAFSRDTRQKVYYSSANFLSCFTSCCRKFLFTHIGLIYSGVCWSSHLFAWLLYLWGRRLASSSRRLAAFAGPGTFLNCKWPLIRTKLRHSVNDFAVAQQYAHTPSVSKNT